MDDRRFFRILLGVTLVCLTLTAAHFLCALYAYQHCSIIYFIGRELWG